MDFFGIYWQSVDGQPHFQGREYNAINKPNVQYYDPDTFEILEMDVPTNLNAIDLDAYGENIDFLQGCYLNGDLKERLSERDRNKLKILFKDVAYQKFLEECENSIVTEGEDDA